MPERALFPHGESFDVNNNFMRTGNNNRNRNNNNRNRNSSNNNNRRNTSGGGNSSNKVFDSNGPDVKVRGTAQTVAEKYMQLGRDAQSSGDSVAAETYYQHAEHYYRLWAANQPVGQSLVMSKKYGEEEFDENGDEIIEEESEALTPESSAVPVPTEATEPQAEGQPPDQGDGQQRPFRNNRDNNNRDQNNRERFKPRWQNRRDRNNEPNREGGVEGQAPAVSADETGNAPAIQQVAPERHEPEAHVPEAHVSEERWEAPSFLQRPTPVVAEAVEAAPEVQERKPRQRKPRAEVVDAPAATPVATEE